VGAYNTAIQWGVHFTEFAGTSAGSIIAVLAGAGATSTQINDFVRELDFIKLLREPEVVEEPKWLVRTVWPERYRSFRDLLFNQGFHSSSGVEEWVENCLRTILDSSQKGPITFSQLPFPTSVVATDIVTSQAKIWNNRSTPDDSVARAVRASCSIPVFFQPVDKRYVDGGTLSNLPSFVFSHTAAGRPLTSRILAFVLKGDDDEIKVWNTKNYLSSVVDTMIEGAQSLQLDLQPDVYVISVPTGKVKATDFDKITPATVNTLINAGVTAANDFFQTELLHVRKPPVPTSICFDREDLYNRIAGHLNDPVQDVLIVNPDARFVYDLFPTLYLWLRRGAKIRAVIHEPHGERKGHSRYQVELVKKLGIQVIELPSLPFRGFIINGDQPERGSAYISSSESNPKGIEAVIYEGTYHAPAIRVFYQQVSDQLIAQPAGSSGLGVVKIPADKLFSRLRNGVAQYASEKVKLTMEWVGMQQLDALATYVHEFKYRQFQHWIPEFEKNGFDLFEPMAVELPGGIHSLITPPVIEDVGKGRFALIQGSTRATFLRDRGDDKLQCVVVRGQEAPLPGTVSSFANVRIMGRKFEAASRIPNFDHTVFRDIERATHPVNTFG
jgi:predicted acylesterase/phospholipase RssA